MKRFIYLLFIIFLFTGCKYNENFQKEKKEMAKQNKFIIEEQTSIPYFTEYGQHNYNGTIIKDTDTGVLYIVISNNQGCGITPYYNSEGKVIVKSDK